MHKITFLLICFLSQSFIYAQERPNIIHIVGDDIGWDDYASFGSTYYKTPQIDRLASEGVRLTNFYAPHSTCTPSRAAFITGRVAPRVNDRTGLGVLFPTATNGLDSAKEITFVKILQQQHYKTALFGKWHLGHLTKFLPVAHGFDEYLGIPYPNDHGPERLGNTGSRQYPPIPLIHNTEKIKDLNNNDLAEVPALFVREACKYIAQRVKNKEPFYLQYSNIETHTPWFVPKGFDGDKADAYADAIQYFDRSVGIILDQVKQLGIENNTIIIFHADNGPLVVRYDELENCYGKYATVDTAKKHVLRDGKYQDKFEGGERVAAIVKWPGKIPAGKTIQEMIAGTDWFTTLLQLTGNTIPTDRVIDGKNVMPLLTGVSTVPVRNTYYAFSPFGNLEGIRYNNWKLVIIKNANKNQPLLFNLKTDPGESTDLSVQYPNIVKSLLALAPKALDAIKNNHPLNEMNNFDF
jgi:arylsulfatase A-like enzyme